MSSLPSLSRLVKIDKAAQVAKPAPAQPRVEEQLSEEAASLPAHIIKCTEPRKLNVQTPIFRCPAWADLPSKGWHLSCTREGQTLPALGLHRYPFYLFGKSSVCDYVLEHPSVSAVHAALVFHKQQECFVLVDLGSTNGCRVNGKLVERQKPIPVPAGTHIQFGYSTRRYEVRTGAPPRREDATPLEAPAGAASDEPHSNGEKRPREAKDTTAPGTREAARAHEGTEPPATAVNRVDNIAPMEQASPTTTLQDGDATAGENEPAPPERMRLYHLVIKHKDVENAVSRAERNKGEAITRSKQDAMDIAAFILRTHAAQQRNAGHDSASQETFDRWTVEEFVAAVEAYSEMATSKKKRAPGDLGMVERGTFSDEFDAAAFSLRREEVSKPIETPLGIHLIYRCD